MANEAVWEWCSGYVRRFGDSEPIWTRCRNAREAKQRENDGYKVRLFSNTEQPAVALSILQPYAWLIVNCYKDVENRSWRTWRRGRIYVHAGKSYSLDAHNEAAHCLERFYGVRLPSYQEMRAQCGGIVGVTTIIDCVREHPSKWKDADSWGFVLEASHTLPFKPCRGILNFFKVPE